MKKFFCVILILVLLCSCNRTEQRENTDTRFLLDTFLTVTADSDRADLTAVFDACSDYEKEFSRTAPNGTVARLNRGEMLTVSDEVRTVLERSLYFAETSGGKFDVTICPVSKLWDFENGVIPKKSAIESALNEVDYRRISLNGNTVSLNGAEIDLGGIAKGYIADRLAEKLKEKGAENGVINFTSSIVIFGKKREIDIRDPFRKGGTAATLSVQNTCISTSGIYERCFTENGVNYHHILDPKTGYGVETDLASATVLCNSAMDGDAISTICILYGTEKAREWVETLDGVEAVLIGCDGVLTYTDGLIKEDGKIVFKKS